MAEGENSLLTDFNDLHVCFGLDAVREQIMRSIEAPEITGQNSEAPKVTKLRLRESARSAPARSVDAGARTWESMLVRNKDGQVSACISNLVKVLGSSTECSGILGLNQFSNNIEKTSTPPWHDFGSKAVADVDYERFRVWFCDQYGTTPKTSDVAGAFLVVAENNRFHPVRDYLTSLIWDGKPRIKWWLGEYLGADCETSSYEERQRYGKYLSLVGWKYLVMAVARVMQPPVKADNVLILEGSQGIGKSEALRILAGDWFSDSTFPLGDKDGYLQMQGKWIIELAELDALNKVESTRAKAFFTSVIDNFRPPYARCTQSFPRQCVFAGTTNQDHYMRDATGNRRYWPVFCNEINHDALKRDRDQLWAEAFHFWRSGARWWVDSDDVDVFREQQESRYSSDAWEDLVVAWLRDPINHKDTYTTAEIMAGALSLEPVAMKPPEQTRVGLIMSRLEWPKKRLTVTKENGKSVREWVYVRPDGFR